MLKIGERKCYCQYDRGVSFEDARGGLRIYIPTAVGYANYNLVHTVSAGRNADIWRLGKAYWVDDSFDKEKELTPEGAEWDMALKLEGRCDFCRWLRPRRRVFFRNKSKNRWGGCRH